MKSFHLSAPSVKYFTKEQAIIIYVLVAMSEKCYTEEQLKKFLKRETMQLDIHWDI